MVSFLSDLNRFAIFFAPFRLAPYSEEYFVANSAPQYSSVASLHFTV